MADTVETYDKIKTMKEGLTFIDDRNNQLRYADKNEFIQWLHPLSVYKAACPIMRGQAVSIATTEDLKENGLKYFNDENYFLKDDPDPYIVPTNTEKHTKSAGLALEPVSENAIGTKVIHVQGFGCFVFDTERDADAIKQGLVYDPGFTYDDVGKKVYVTNIRYSTAGDDVTSEPGGMLTVDQSAIYKSYHNFILIGYLTDAPVKGKESDQHLTKIELAMQGDDRGPIDATVFEGVLGEDAIVPSEDPCRVFALGQEDDVKFKSRIIYVPTTNYEINKKTAFIGFQKMDGSTSLVTFSDDFSIANVQNSMVQEDAAFLAIANIYIDSYNKNIENNKDKISISITKCKGLKNTLDEMSMVSSRDSLIDALKTAWQNLTGYTLNCEATKTEDLKTVIKIDMESNEPGGYYYMYISDTLAPVFGDSVTFQNGSSANKGTVVVADCRIASRQNIIGVWYNNELDTVVKKGTTCLFMHDGLFTHNTNRYPELGQEYFLGRNGTVTHFPLEAYDTVVKVLDVQDNNKLLIHCDNARKRTNGGDLPTGYMKPAVKAGEEYVAEYGFLLMDGTSRYSYNNYTTLYERLTAWYPESMLKKGQLPIGTDDDGNTIYEDEVCFTIPLVTTVTDVSEKNTMQIKAVTSGIYEKDPRIPYIRKFGSFEKENQYVQIDDNRIGIIHPTINKYTKITYDENGKKLKEEVIDNRFDISPICDLSVKIDGVEDPTLENLDIHLYIDPEYGDDSRTDGLYHWVEVRSGFKNFNNTTTYGFEWKIERETPSPHSVYTTYYLSTDIKDGMGIYYQTAGSVVPTNMAGKPWKISVSRRETLPQQYDLDGVMSSYLTNDIADEKDNFYTNRAATGKAVIDAIENRYHVKKLVAYHDNSEIYLGKETEPANIVNISAEQEIPFYSSEGLKFETTLKDGAQEDAKIYYRDNRFILVAGTNANGETLGLPKMGDMQPDELVTKAQVQEHENLDATKYTTKTATDPEIQKVHGMIFGLGGNIDASKINGIYLATHNSTVINDDVSKTVNDFKAVDANNNKSYIPYTYYGTDIISGKSGYIVSEEGYTVHQSLNLGDDSASQYSSEVYYSDTNKNTDKNLYHDEYIKGNYRTFNNNVIGYSDSTTGADNSVVFRTVYNFNATEKTGVSATPDSGDGDYDIEFKRSSDGGKTFTPASIKAGSIGITSKAAFKEIFGEDIRSYAGKDASLYTISYNGNSNRMSIAAANNKYDEYIGSALQAAYELPLAFWHYNNEPSWYKKYIGIVIERVNEVRDKLTTEDARKIFNELDQDWTLTDKDGNTVKSTKPFNDADNTFTYSDNQLLSIKTYLNSITDNAETAQNVISSIGLLFKAAKETQERLLKIEASTFGADAPTIPGRNAEDKITFPQTPDVTPEATHLGLNRLIRAMSMELYGTANPADSILSKDFESNNTQTTLSRIDELETEVEGKTFDNEITTDSSDNDLNDIDATTYPYNIADTHHENETDEALTDYDPVTGRSKNKVIFDKSTGKNINSTDTETTDSHGTWTKVDLEKEQTFTDNGNGSFTQNTSTNLVPEDNRFKFNGIVDAIARICTKVNALTYTINGTNNIDSTPRRLNTIRNNIETLIKEAYFDGEPTVRVDSNGTDSAGRNAYTADIQTELESRQYKDQDTDKFDEDKPQPSVPYTKKGSTYKELSGLDDDKGYTGISRFDQLSRDLYGYILTTRKSEHDYTLNGHIDSENGNESSITEAALQYTSGTDKDQVLLGRTFNGKKLLIDGVGTKVKKSTNEYDLTGDIKDGVKVSEINGSVTQNKNVSVRINIPNSIEEYDYANIIDILIDAIGPAYFRQVFDNNVSKAYDDQTLRDTRTITTRIENIESALDNVVRKLCQHHSFELDSTKTEGDATLSSIYEGDTFKTYSIEEFIKVLNHWLGLTITEEGVNSWEGANSKLVSTSTAELAAGYDGKNKIVYKVNNKGTSYEGTLYTRDANGNYTELKDKSTISSDTVTYIKSEDDNNYLDTLDPVVNSNFIIKQLLKRLRGEEAYSDAIKKILGDDYSTENALAAGQVQKNDSTGTASYTYHEDSDYNLTDDVRDLLLTVYGTDTNIGGDSKNSAGMRQTEYEHRTHIATASYLGTKVWKRNTGTESKYVFTTLLPKVGDYVYKTYSLLDTNNETNDNIYGTIETIGTESITVQLYNSSTTENWALTNDEVNGSTEINDNAYTRFTGNGETRNIIDDIIHEMYFVPQPKNYGKDTSIRKNTDPDYDIISKDVTDSIQIAYGEKSKTDHIYYDFDSKRYQYDYDRESHSNIENGGRTGHAIGYNNRGTLFNDYLNNNSSYRRSRMEVLEDEIRHLRSFLGLDDINVDTPNATNGDNLKISTAAAVETKYGGHFLVTGTGELAGHKFSANATRNGNMYTNNKTAAISPYKAKGNENQDTNLLTLLFNLDNAIKDISRELGTETNYHGYTTSRVNGESINYANYEQLNKEREMTIYDRLNSLEDLTGSLLGEVNKVTENHDGESDNEEDFNDESGLLAIQWIEE